MKKHPLKLPKSVELPNYAETEKRVFEVVKGEFYIGGEKMEANLLGVLRDDAMFIQSSRLWEILNASVINEAYNLALIQSKDFDNVQFAKALKHWSHFMLNAIHLIAKED